MKVCSTTIFQKAGNIFSTHSEFQGKPEIFENLPRYADWPTFPQIYINHELTGGGDIILEMMQNGQLKGVCEEAVASSKA